MTKHISGLFSSTILQNIFRRFPYRNRLQLAQVCHEWFCVILGNENELIYDEATIHEFGRLAELYFGNQVHWHFLLKLMPKLKNVKFDASELGISSDKRFIELITGSVPHLERLTFIAVDVDPTSNLKGFENARSLRYFEWTNKPCFRLRQPPLEIFQHCHTIKKVVFKWVTIDHNWKSALCKNVQDIQFLDVSVCETLNGKFLLDHIHQQPSYIQHFTITGETQLWNLVPGSESLLLRLRNLVIENSYFSSGNLKTLAKKCPLLCSLVLAQTQLDSHNELASRFQRLQTFRINKLQGYFNAQWIMNTCPMLKELVVGSCIPNQSLREILRSLRNVTLVNISTMIINFPEFLTERIEDIEFNFEFMMLSHRDGTFGLVCHQERSFATFKQLSNLVKNCNRRHVFLKGVSQRKIEKLKSQAKNQQLSIIYHKFLKAVKQYFDSI